MEGIIKLSINKPYSCHVKGFGEIFEIKSIERIRKKLKHKYGEGYLYLSSNEDHSGRGITLEELIESVETNESTVLESGYADAPPWSSEPLGNNEKSSKMESSILRLIVPILFSIWIPLFENFFKKRNKSHVIWVFGVKDEK